MYRMTLRRMFQVQVPPGADTVFLGITLPSGSRIDGINMRCSLVGVTVLGLMDAVAYAVEGWILPLPDPDAAPSLSTLWDQMVPKDTDAETLDLDQATADATPFWEPGELDPLSIFNIGLRPERVFARRRLLTINEAGVHVFQDNQSPFDPVWFAGDRFKFNTRRKLRVHAPSVMVFALGVPNLDDTSAADLTALTEAQIAQVQYMEHVIERAFMHQLGLTEAGAETPWEEASALIKAHVDPDVFELNANTFKTVSWNLFGDATIGHSVPGRIATTRLNTGR